MHAKQTRSEKQHRGSHPSLRSPPPANLRACGAAFGHLLFIPAQAQSEMQRVQGLLSGVEAEIVREPAKRSIRLQIPFTLSNRLSLMAKPLPSTRRPVGPAAVSSFDKTAREVAPLLRARAR